MTAALRRSAPVIMAFSKVSLVFLTGFQAVRNRARMVVPVTSIKNTKISSRRMILAPRSVKKYSMG